MTAVSGAEKSAVNALAQRIAHVNSGLASIRAELGEHADRTFGSIPQPAGDDPPRSSGRNYGGNIGDTEEAVTALEREITLLEGLITRFRAL